MQHTRNTIKKALSLLLVFVMILSALPATIFAADTDTTVYLKPNSNWTQSSAWFAMYYWDNNGDHWAKMTDADGDGYYEAVLPAGFTNVIFCRMNPASTALSWDSKWDQTNDLTFSGKNCFTVANGAWNNANGTWSDYTPATTPDEPDTPVTPPASGNSYYLVGWINDTDYNGEDYQFVNGKLTTTFPSNSYIAVKDQTGDWYMTASYVTGTTGTFAKGNPEKMYVPGNQQVTFTLVENSDGTLSVSYSTETAGGSEEKAYYLVGWIDNTDYTGNDYAFEDGKLTATFSSDTYIYVKDQNGVAYNTEAYCTGTTGTFAAGNTEKMFIPADQQVTFTLTENADGSLTVSYVQGAGGNEGGGEGTGEKCNVTLHFADTLGWGQATLYSWAGSSDVLLGGWPGTSLSQDENGFYSHTYEVTSGQTINFIFNNGGGSQTVDLSLGVVTGDVEKWVRISGESDGKYTADILSQSFVVVQSPVVKDDTVTFNYEGGTSVQVYGSWDQWAAGKAMTKNSDGIWTITLQDLEPGTYEYKFVVDGSWIKDPVNGWSQNDNSAFIVLDPDAKDKNTITLNIHYSRGDNAYEGWNMYLYNGSGNLTADSETLGEDGLVTTLVLEGRAVQYVNVIPRLSTLDNKWASQEATQTIDLGDVLSGTVDYYITSGSSAGVRVLNTDVVTGNKLSDAQLDYDQNIITVTFAKPVTDAQFELVNVEDASDDISLASVTGGGTTYTLTPSKTLTLDKLYQYKIKFEGYTYDIDIDSVYASDKFGAEYTYTGTDLGANWSQGATTFRVWAPTATDVKVNLYTSGTAGTKDLIKAVPMNRDVNGTWVVTVDGDLNGTYYTYAVNVDGEIVEACDPYARTTGVNGDRAMVIDLDSTDPDGWENDTNPNPSTSYTDAIIYELHVRDFSIDDSSGIIEDYQGKFLAFTQEGSTVNGKGSISTGIDYLKALGVTHVHLLPVYDYESVDESRLEDPQFNWGYDPQNYNVPEGSYSTDPYKGEVRVEEFKKMVMALHEAGISVIMDVVYNHVYDAGTFCFNNIVPGYFSRVNSNGSGCGNDTASEREMVHKYIVESVVYWTEEYHIDGFRFDLVGLIDTQTINTLVDAVHEIRPDAIFYGEGWTLGTNSEPGYSMATQQNAAQTPEFAYFSDVIRNLLAGTNGSSTGYVSGATGQEASIIANFKATPWYSSNPEQIIQYASCHDNYTLIDKLIKSTGAIGVTDKIINMNNLTAAIYMASQGIPFIHAGEEMLREKLEEDGGRCENSYNATDFVNSIKWDHLLEEEYADTVEYYQGLIAFRKAHPALRMTSSADIAKYIQAAVPGGNVTAFLIDGVATGDDDIFVIFNANQNPVTVNLPSGIWNVCVDGDDSGTDALYTAQVAVQLKGISAMYLTRKDEGENETYSAGGSIANAVTVYFSDSQNWGSVYAYTWSPELSGWPGVPMTWVETNEYGQNVYSIEVSASSAGLVFSNGSGTQTVDLTVPADGMGYYPESNEGGKWTCGSYKYRDPISGGTGGEEDTPAGEYVGDSQYFLFGWINGENYGCEETANSMGKYQFVNGQLTVEFEKDSYVGVKTTGNKKWYMTDGWLGNVADATLVDSTQLGTDANKLMIPGGVSVTLYLNVIDDAKVNLRYEINQPESVVDGSGVQDGLTLHCWNWSFAEIEANMAKIAEQGYTAIQTSPVQPIKESTVQSQVMGSWWVYYQPVDFVIADQDFNALGTKAQLQSMIDTAHKYGIKVIVDVVANHLANQTGNDLSDKIPAELQETAYWHSIYTNITDYSDRYQCTQQCMGGLPDLNTHNAQLQQMVLDFLCACVDMGVDGFRFDAAKHIETPEDELPYDSNFWPNVIFGAEKYAQKTQSKDLYMYGEVLDSQANIPVSAYTKYMAITDNSWGNTLRENIANGVAAMSPGYDKPAQADDLVIWAESHDTYATDQAALSSMDETEAEIIRTWALVAARADAMGLYLARPESNTQLLGVGSVTGWADETVKEINLFHNAFKGQTEHISNQGDISYVERGTSGVILVNAKGNGGAVSVSAKAMADGQYMDQITGNVFTVAEGKISGIIGDTGIAVVYNVPEQYTVTITETVGGTVTVSETNPYAGAAVTLNIIPNAGYEIDTVTVTAANGEEVTLRDKRSVSYSFSMPESDVTVTVTFLAVNYQVIVGSNADGKVTVSNETPKYGETVTITVEPVEGKKVDKVIVTDQEGNTVPVKSLGGNKYSFTQPEGNVTVSVTYRDDNGSLAPTGEGNLAFVLMSMMLLSAAMVFFLYEKQKKAR